MPGRSNERSVPFQIATLLYTETYAAIGGYVPGRIARAISPVYILAAIAFLLTAAAVLLAANALPTWYIAASLLLLVPATLLGGWIATAQGRNLPINERQGLRL